MILVPSRNSAQFDALTILRKPSNDFSRFWAEIQFVYANDLRRIATLIEPNEYWGRTIEPKKIENLFVKISGFGFNKVEILNLPEKKSKNP